MLLTGCLIEFEYFELFAGCSDTVHIYYIKTPAEILWISYHCECGCEWNANQMAIFRYLHFRLADIMFTFQNKKERKRRTLKLMELGDCALFNATQIHFSAQISCEGNVLYSDRDKIFLGFRRKIPLVSMLRKVSSCWCKTFHYVVCLCTVRVILSMRAYDHSFTEMNCKFASVWIIYLRINYYGEVLISIKKIEQTCTTWMSMLIRF